MLDVDLSGAWRTIRAVGAAGVRQRSGSVVNVSSTAGLVGYRNFCAYVAAKHGLDLHLHLLGGYIPAMEKGDVIGHDLPRLSS